MGPGYGRFGGVARPGTGSYAGVGAVLRGGNHLNWGVAPRRSAPRIAIPAVQPEIRPFFGFDARPAEGATHRARNNPKWTQTGAGAGAAGRCRPQSPSRAPQKGYKASRTRTEGPWARYRAVSGRFWPFLAVSGLFRPLLGPAQDPAPPPLTGAPAGAWRIVLAQNSGFGQGTGGETWGQSFGPEPEPEPEPWLFCFCDVLLACLLLVASSYYGERGVVIIGRTLSTRTWDLKG